jgi:lactoylglutathione lyase
MRVIRNTFFTLAIAVMPLQAAAAQQVPPMTRTLPDSSDTRLGYTILYVRDVKATVEFYERAFALKRRMLKEGEYGEVETGATRLAFAADSFARKLTPVAHEPAAPGKAAPPVELAFVTKNVAAAYSRALASGATMVARPEKKPWGQIVGYVRDLNGFLIEICSPLP